MLESKDNNLIQRIMDGDAEAETALLKKFSSHIIRKVSFQLGEGNEDWKDVAADVQMALLLSIRQGQFDTSRGVSLGSYVYGITANKLRDYFKSQKKRPIRFCQLRCPYGHPS